MADQTRITAKLQRFDGPSGWFYVPFDETFSRGLRPLVTQHWPALLKVRAEIAGLPWTASIMPIRDGPLFVAIPAKIRRKLEIGVGDVVTLDIDLEAPQ